MADKLQVAWDILDQLSKEVDLTKTSYLSKFAPGWKGKEPALREQVTSSLLEGEWIRYASYVSFGLGNLFVLSSMYALGITGTYLGDYFGILMDERVTGFPFNVLDNPMYVGSTLSFLGTSLYFKKPAGLFATLWVHVLYSIALKFEE
ncbi:Methylene-fatty-acyl-phospholipid synthase [Wickerhamomyces ciferrii]|uniref:phosphatidyl-N-methylethanolamine N-methyltransferase n=1 Tax=Wickerhamomyces ciferrii (strain ATCC 14091 / BCRC 22168 / CBS 111 / JCM 3599 / NBRC 0793 / NRRL Y-1031 F-60-10) TaxID=1206466 RepID=K0KHX7_WICCF|nr:Methylene-fatty-acyl-phospholipid synthase [Wickerhamomyces ciferrii]CCH41009.1 Methylene-fatty-acyl-phospholipid synthase [Wickerhamomyces ciferrii]